MCIAEYSPKLHNVEGPRDVIVNTFSRLSHQDDTSALVGKKAITEDSALASHSLFDDKEIFECLVKLPCLISRKKRKQQKSEKRCRDTDTNQQYCYHHCHHDTDTNQH